MKKATVAVRLVDVIGVAVRKPLMINLSMNPAYRSYPVWRQVSTRIIDDQNVVIFGTR